MVPYQLLHSIDALDKVKKLIVGGGAISTELEAQLQNKSTEVFATYGMTETVTHVAVRRINGFAKSDVFTALPDVKFSVDNKGCLVIDAPKVSNDTVVTNDLVDLQSPLSFIWLGRYDNVINSGGVKMNPEEIEAKLSVYITIPFIICAENDTELGERLILILESQSGDESPNYTEAFSVLSSYERPKKIYTLSQFPYTESGKIKRADVLRLVKSYKK
jgi:O-succinylbenzoic acid--CoA ligase